MRATFLAGGSRIEDGDRPQRAQHRPRADGVVPARHPRCRSRARASCGATSSTTATLHADLDRRAERLPRSARADHDADRHQDGDGRWCGAARDAVRRGREGAPRTDAAAGGGRQRRRFAAELGAAAGHPDDRRRERLGAGRDGVRQPRVRLRRRAHPAARGAGELPVPLGQHRRRGHQPRTGVGEAVVRVPGQRRARRRDRRDRQEHARSSSRRATPRGCCSSTRPSGSSASRRSCAAQGVDVQVVVIHEGSAAGNNAIGATAATPWTGPINEHRRQAAGQRASTSSSPVTRTGSPTRWSGGSRSSRASTRAAATPSPS